MKNSFGGLPPPVDSYCFFGEKYRTCFDRLHITDGAKVVLLVDLVKTVLETLFFSSKIGYLDSFIVLHLSWTALGYLGCLLGFCKLKYFWFWPSIVLKITEVVVGLLCMAAIFVLLLIGAIGSNVLRTFIKWKYPRIEANETIGFCLLLFVVLGVLLVVNALVGDVVFRAQLFYRRRAMALYSLERQVIMRRILVH